MWLATAIGSALLFGLAGWWMKVSQMRGDPTSVMLFGLYAAGAAGFGVHAAAEGTLTQLLDYRVWLAGLVIGAGSALGNAFYMKALRHGPAALTSQVTNMNVVLVVMMGTWIYGESLGPAELAGISLLFVAVLLISYKKSGDKAALEKAWAIYVGAGLVLFFFRNGGLKVSDELGLPAAPILLVGYALSMLWFAFRLPLRSQPDGERTGSLQGLRLGLLTGVFSYLGLQLYSIALATGPANIAAPIFSTNSLVVAAGAILVYKEKLNPLQWAAFACMFAGLIIIRF
ncbi:DMT family transporter [Paenibacillus sp. NPDC058071]|uniref:DMT family transporter n=1 Tax=Paenibacillus sp. NPDC058071 TaxID=3346326 RepID=UPI0036DF6D5B